MERSVKIDLGGGDRVKLQVSEEKSFMVNNNPELVGSGNEKVQEIGRVSKAETTPLANRTPLTVVGEQTIVPKSDFFGGELELAVKEVNLNVESTKPSVFNKIDGAGALNIQFENTIKDNLSTGPANKAVDQLTEIKNLQV